MARFIAFAGFSGSGKTTCIHMLQNMLGGERVYLGQTVLDKIRSRNLPVTPENERQTRAKFRAEHGEGALAKLAVPTLKRLLEANTNVFIDAIFENAELHVLNSECKEAQIELWAVMASFETRSIRLVSRVERPLTKAELVARDEIEQVALKLPDVLAAAQQSIENEGTFADLQQNLINGWGRPPNEILG